jgi:hypothetical protein
LLQALGEVVGSPSGFSGYRRWMDLVCQWYVGKEAEEDEKNEKAGSGSAADEEKAPLEVAPPSGVKTTDQDSTETAEEVGKDQADPEDGSQDPDEELDHEEDGDAGSDGDPEPDQEEPLAAVEENLPEPGGQEGGETGATDTGEGVAKDDGFHELAEAIKTYAPLVQGSALEIECSEASEAGSGVRKVPIPDLRPGDPVFNLILETSDLSEFHHQVRLFEPQALSGIDDAIQGVLADRATEKTLEGYSVPVPPAITRKDLFSLAGGVIPAVWERRWGVERPNIDLYIDVSGSMGYYYGYIPYIYDALRAVRGRVFQFSTRVVEVDPEDPFLHTTGGTRFDAVAQHLLAAESRAAIILSDGHGLLSNRHIEALKAQLETLIYIKVQPNREQNWEHVATEVIVLTWSDDPEG